MQEPAVIRHENAFHRIPQYRGITSISSSRSRIYGQNVHCRLPLPFPSVEFETPDIDIFFEDGLHHPPGPRPHPWVRQWFPRGDKRVLRYLGSDGHVFECVFTSNGKRIFIRQSCPEWRNALFILLNPALAVSLYLQGMSPLHATSLVRNKEAYLFAGISGAGKSSLAAALIRQGLALHADDISVFSLENGRPVVQAGYPRLKITPEAAAATGWNGSSLDTIFFSDPAYPKKWLSLSDTDGGFHETAAPIKAVYVLCDRSHGINFPMIDELSPCRRVLFLARHVYGYPWLQKQGKRVLTHCAGLADSVPVFAIRLPEGLDKLHASARFVIRHMNTIKGRSNCHNTWLP